MTLTLPGAVQDRTSPSPPGCARSNSAPNSHQSTRHAGAFSGDLPVPVTRSHHVVSAIQLPVPVTLCMCILNSEFLQPLSHRTLSRTLKQPFLARFKLFCSSCENDTPYPFPMQLTHSPQNPEFWPRSPCCPHDAQQTTAPANDDLPPSNRC